MPNRSPNNPPPRPIQDRPGGPSPDGPASPTNPGDGGVQPQPPGPPTNPLNPIQLQSTEDPDAGGEIGFGDGAMPRPVTMTAGDLGIAEDPDAGGEVAEDPDAGGEVFPHEAPTAEDVSMIVDALEPDAFEPEPEPELADLEVATDFDQAIHTFEPGEG